MASSQIEKQIHSFKKRIIETLNFKSDTGGIIESTRRLCAWVAEQEVKMEKEKE